MIKLSSNMITVYTSPSCASCKKVIAFFKEQDIPYIEKNIFAITLREDEVRDILKKSENGSDDIISPRSKIIKEKRINVYDMTVSELIKFIIANPSVLKRPIMVDDHRIQVGYNADEIRAFIPREKRIASWACLNCPTRDECNYPDLANEIRTLVK